jgi:hypothetical protein
MKNVYTLCAEGIVRSADDDSITIYNVLEAIQPAGFPIMVQHFFFLSVLEKTPDEPERVECTVRLTLGDQELLNRPLTLDFQGRKMCRSINKFQGLFLPGPGQLTASVYQNDTLLSSYTVHILDAIQMSQTPAAPQSITTLPHPGVSR